MKELIKPNSVEQSYETVETLCGEQDTSRGCYWLECVCRGFPSENTSSENEEDILF